MFKLFRRNERLTVLTCEDIAKGLTLINPKPRKTIGPKYRIFIGGHFMEVPWNAKVFFGGHAYKPKQLRIKTPRF